MSFVRRLENNKRPKKPRRKKPEWDDTVNDLTVYRASPDEIAYRKVSHMSTNKDVVQEDKFKKVIRKARLKEQNNSNAERRKANILKEVIMDQSQLQDVLSKSDKALAIVQDLFGDDPKRFTGFPNVTTAPGQIIESTSGSVNKSSSLLPAPPDLSSSQLELLSSYVMNSSALNDLENSQSDSDEELEENEAPAFKSQLDLHRFQKFLLSELNDHNEKEKSEMILENPANPKNTQTDGHEEGVPLEEDSDTEPAAVVAINDTAKVKRVKSMINEESKNTASDRQQAEVRQVLQGLQQNVPESEYQHTGAEVTEEALKSDSTLGHAVLKLVHCLKETERRLQTESTLREQLSQDVYQLRTWVDALTADLITCQEDYSRLASEFTQYRQVSHLHILQLQEKCGISPQDAQRLISQRFPVHNTIPTTRGQTEDVTCVPVHGPPLEPSQVTVSQSQPSQPPAKIQSQDGNVSEKFLGDGGKPADQNPKTAPVTINPAILLSPPRQTHTPSHDAQTQNDVLRQNLLGQFEDLHIEDSDKGKSKSEPVPAPDTVQVRVPQPISLNLGQSSFTQQNKLPRRVQQQNLPQSNFYATNVENTTSNHPAVINGQKRVREEGQLINPLPGSIDQEQENLQKELEELTRQHQDAQLKLQSLLQQNQLQSLVTGMNSGQQRRVSPPLSPISQGSSQSAVMFAASRAPNGRQVSSHDGVVIRIPHLQDLAPSSITSVSPSSLVQ